MDKKAIMRRLTEEELVLVAGGTHVEIDNGADLEKVKRLQIGRKSRSRRENLRKSCDDAVHQEIDFKDVE